MTYTDNVYRLYEETNEGITKYFISFRDSTGEPQALEVSEAFYIEFRKMERRNRNLQQSQWRHKEHLELTEQALHRRAKVYPKSIEDTVIEAERSEQLQCAIDKLPDIQRRRFLLYYEYDYNLREIGEIEGYSLASIRKSVCIARDKIRKAMENSLN